MPGQAAAERAPKRARDPDVWLARVAWSVIALSLLQILLFGFGRDQGIYAVVGDAILRGKMPYRDAWDFKPPGIFLVYAAAEALFGHSMVSVRLVEIASFAVMVFVFRGLGREMLGSSVAGLLGASLAVLVHAELEFWHTAQPEAFGGVLTVCGLALSVGQGAVSPSFPRRAAAWVGAGVLFGVAFLMKPPLGGGAVVCAAYLARSEHHRDRRPARALLPAVVMALGSFLPIVACAIWFVVRGAWPSLAWTLFEFTPGYTALGWNGTPLGFYRYAFFELLVGFSYLLPFGLACAAAFRPMHGREREALLLVAGIASVHVAGIALQAKFFQYHYSATLPLVAWASGIGLYKLWRRVLRFGAPGVFAFSAVVTALVASRVALRHNPGTFWERSYDRMKFLTLRSPTREELDGKLYHVVDYDLDVDRRAARTVARIVPEGRAVYVWGFEPAVYWFSARPPASRYIYDVPQRAAWQRERARADLLSDLAATPPAAIVVQHGDVFGFVTGDELDSHRALETFPELRRMLKKEFSLVDSVDDLDVYARRSDPSEGPAEDD